MKRLAVLGVILLLAGVALAGENPDARIYIDFDPPNYVHEIWPAVYTGVTACICLDQLEGGACVVSFRMEDPSVTCPGVAVATT